jgi:lipopolysaccharide transport system ATP-binding protein
VGSLLEVGTGFHPELTGRENVLLNGAILGMKRSEIEAKFDEIVDFSGVEKFIETPVKHYSTGMGLRLAFAVAAHLNPEILIVDEVLAVGDAAFQQKCLGKMGEVAQSGRTVLLVSHNMGAITRLCQRAFLLSHGRLVGSGPSEDVVGGYLSNALTHEDSWSRSPEEEAGPHKEALLESVRILDRRSQQVGVVPFGEEFQVEIGYSVNRPIRGLAILFAVLSDRGEVVWVSEDTDSTDLAGQVREPGAYVSTCKVPPRLLKPGRYFLNVGGHVPRVKRVDAQLRVIGFDVSPAGYSFNPRREGAITPVLEWTVRRA